MQFVTRYYPAIGIALPYLINYPEYPTIIQCTPELTMDLKDDLITLSGELLADGLIADDNAAALNNQHLGARHRAAQLMGFMRNKVSLDNKIYHSFIRVLKHRQDDHKNILEILDRQYKELGKSVVRQGKGSGYSAHILHVVFEYAWGELPWDFPTQFLIVCRWFPTTRFPIHNAS